MFSDEGSRSDDTKSSVAQDGHQLLQRTAIIAIAVHHERDGRSTVPLEL